MTRAEAIKWLEEAVNDTNNDFDLCGDALKKELLLQKNVFEMAISALKYPQGEWISVKDRLPKTGTVLATNGTVVITAPSSSVTLGGAITHWMPLPEPPEDRG